MRDAFCVNLIECRCNLAYLSGAEKAANDCVSVSPIMRQIGLYAGRLLAPQWLRRTHGSSPAPQGEYINSLRFP
jgi:hypothetical protein